MTNYAQLKFEIPIIHTRKILETNNIVLPNNNNNKKHERIYLGFRVITTFIGSIVLPQSAGERGPHDISCMV